MVINGLPLPHELLALLAAGRWRAPADPSGIDRLFPNNGGLSPYSTALMETETRTLHDPQLQAAIFDDANFARDGSVTVREITVADFAVTGAQPAMIIDARTSTAEPSITTPKSST